MNTHGAQVAEPAAGCHLPDDCIVVKVRQDNSVANKAIFLALGINLEGHKELPGMWIAENEGAKFWLGVLTELQNRGGCRTS